MELCLIVREARGDDASGCAGDVELGRVAEILKSC